MRKTSFLIAILLLFSRIMFAQVSVNTDGSPPNTSAILDVQSTTKGMLIPRMTSALRTAITNPVNGLMVYQTDSISGFYYYNSSKWQRIGESNHYIGELFGGGIVFWVDNTGQHGLIVSLVDVSTYAQWSDVYTVTGAVSTWNGEANSAIIAGISPAAQLCLNYTNSNYGTGTYSDWYLPAIDQLCLIFQTRSILNKTIETIPGANILNNYSLYWSSTEDYYSYPAWYFRFSEGSKTNGKNNFFWVRAVRTF